ncbi:hypothetical protein BDN70DRAFT_938136 [Pholiota conissans]|uniref:Uncharacterized protein n=1 Tax=Pholiota conissans TaxID=109636 RepID=A0A9P6CMP4_9AGAR|nr:hypothetical protein BDN70DRAFT_938136 [Pholiota conissans]
MAPPPSPKHPLLCKPMVSEWRHTLSNGLVVMERPKEGWPKRHMFDHPFKGLVKSQRESWLANTKPALLASTWHTGQGTIRDSYNKLSKLLPQLIHAPGLEIGIPTPADPPATSAAYAGVAPYHFLITGLSQMAVNMLIYMKVAASAECVAFFIPVTMQNSEYLGTIEGLYFNSAAADRVRTAVQNSLRTEGSTLTYLREHLPQDPEVANKLIDSITVEPIEIIDQGGDKVTVWNILCTPPPLPHADYVTWMDKVRKLELLDKYGGRGTFRVQRQFHCIACQSVSHPTGLCPFPLVKGWLGQPATTSMAEDASIEEVKTPKHQAPTGRGGGKGHATRGHRTY